MVKPQSNFCFSLQPLTKEQHFALTAMDDLRFIEFMTFMVEIFGKLAAWVTKEIFSGKIFNSTQHTRIEVSILLCWFVLVVFYGLIALLLAAWVINRFLMYSALIIYLFLTSWFGYLTVVCITALVVSLNHYVCRIWYGVLLSYQH